MKPDYTTRDLFTYGGFIAGISAFMLSTQAWDVHRLLRLLCGAGVGLVLGFVGGALYDRINAHFSEDNDRRRIEDDEGGPRF